MADTNARMMLIGLDAADKDLIEGWIATGDLPTFKMLHEKSTWADIENPRGLEAGSCWPTFYFGLSPAKTGQFDGGRKFDPASYEFFDYSPEQNLCDPIWTTLSKAGKLCCVIDAPYSYPTDQVNGIKIVDRAAHVPAGGGYAMKFRTHPPELADEIIELFGPDLAGGHASDFLPVDTAEEVEAFRNLYLQRMEKKTDMALHYWKQRPWDFFMIAYTEAHCVGHRCWHIHDPEHPRYDSEVSKAAGDPVKEIYKGLDRSIARLVEAAGEDVEVLVYLSHGMGPRYSATRLLDRVLTRLDGGHVATNSGPMMNLVRAVWRSLPDQIRKPLWGVRTKVSNDGFQPNRQGRRFFEVFANDRTGGIRINLAGREAQGIVQPGDEYDALCRQLVADLSEMQNAETGEPLAKEILITKEHYSGDCLADLPDVLVTWNRSHPIRAVYSPRLGQIDSTGLRGVVRSGDHCPVGRFFALAPHLPYHRLNDDVKVQDFAPTIARFFSVPLEKSDGHAISALVPPPQKEKAEALA